MSRYIAAALVVSLAILLGPASSRAHFVLQAPPNWAQQDTQGLPLKSAPCGQADPLTPAVATGIVTAFASGATVTITINETIPHPGHYRVVLSTIGRNGLPADPPVTAGGTPSTPCGSTTIQNPAVFPVLADGQLLHTSAITGSRSFTVTLPSGMTCASNCVLQVVEFMSNHALNNPGGCFYHHCADITIGAGTGTGGAGGGAGGRGGAGGAGGRGGGGGGAAGRGGAGGVTGTAGRGGTTGTGGTTTTGTAGSVGSTGAGGDTATGTAGTVGSTGAGGTTATGTAGTTGAGGDTATGTAGTVGTGGTSATGTAGTTGGGGPDSGCSCVVGGAGASAPALLLMLAVATTRRRRRRR